MKENRDILNEAFFKRATYEEKQNAKLPQYAPVDAKEAKNGSGIVPEKGAFKVADSEELKRRLAGTFGVTFGGNSVKSMASKAIKTFPIIVSDNVEPETVIMLKKLMEEQYAEYINLLISNQVIDLADYRANEGDGNIAIQALDKISGSSFGKTKAADKAARTGTISADDVFSTIPLYTLLRENNLVINTGDELTNNLLEGALIVPADKSKDLAEFVMNYADDITALNEAGGELTARTFLPDTNDGRRTVAGNRSTLLPSYKYTGVADINNPDETADFDQAQGFATLTRDTNIDLRRGYVGTTDAGKDVLEKLTTADIVFDERMLDHAINRSIGDLLTDRANVAIRDRFEKATYLLQSRRIAGIEYYQYLTLRLGIPVSDDVRKKLMRNYKVGDIRDYSGNGRRISLGTGKTQYDDFLISNKHAERIFGSKEIDGLLDPILSPTIRDVLIGFGAFAAGAGIGLSAGLTVGTIGRKSLGKNWVGWEEFFKGVIDMPNATGFMDFLGASAFIAGPIIGAIAGTGSYLLYRALKRRKSRTKLEGWERVERLIIIMENRQAEIVRQHNDKEISDVAERARRDRELQRIMGEINKAGIADRHAEEEVRNVLERETGNSYVAGLNAITNRVSILANDRSIRHTPAIRESADTKEILTFKEMKFEKFPLDEELAALTEEVMADPEIRAEILAERAVRTTMPMQIKYVEKKPGADVLYAPANFTRSSYAYGSTEIERKDNKDRRYNQPLIMKVTFKERYSDGKFADNELTAVIGILGKVIRIPSEEMQYILTENTKGKTIEGIISGGLDNAISELLSKSKISNELKKLPQSADIWHNLEKVATLAAANSITGRRNNNIANAHIVFSQKEIDACRIDTGVDYLKDKNKSIALMKRYSAFTLMVANDPGQRVYIFDDQDDVSWNVLPYSALAGKDNGEQLAAALNKLGRL